MEQIIIRKATLADLDTLLVFEQGVIKAERPFDSTLKANPLRYYNLEEMITAPHIELAVAELGQQIIASGYIRIENSKPYLQHDKHGYLGFMYVTPNHRGKGINKKIIDFLKDWAETKNITELILDVYIDNINAVKAYEKIGFVRHLLEMRMNINKPKAE